MQPENIEPISGSPLNLPLSRSEDDLILKRSDAKEVRDVIHPVEPPPPNAMTNVSISITESLEPIDHLKKDHASMKENVGLIAAEVKGAEVLAHVKAPKMREVVKDQTTLARMMSTIGQGHEFEKAMMIPLESIMQEFIDTLKERAAEGLEFGDPILKLPEEVQMIADKIVDDIMRTQLAIRAPTQLLLGGILIHRSTVLDAAERLLTRIKSGELPEYKHIQHNLEATILEQRAVIREEARNIAVETISYVPQALQTIFKDVLSHLSPAMMVISTGAAVSWVATSAYSLYKAAVGASEHKAFIKQQKPSGHDIPAEKRSGIVTPVEQLLLKRKQAHAASRNNLKKNFFELLDSFKSNFVGGGDYKNIRLDFLKQIPLSNVALAWKFEVYMDRAKPQLKPGEVRDHDWLMKQFDLFKTLNDQGKFVIDPPPGVVQKEEVLIVKLSDNERLEMEALDRNELPNAVLDKAIISDIYRIALLDQRTAHQQTLTVETKKAVQALALKKLTSEKKFFNFRLGSSATLFSMSTIAAAGTIALKVLACVGIIAATSMAISLPGLGLFVGGTILVAAGLFFLYKYKPNLFKGLLKGTAIALAFNKIPLAYYNYQLNKAKIHRDENTAYVNFLSPRLGELEQLKNEENLDFKNTSAEMRALLDNLKRKAAEQNRTIDKADLDYLELKMKSKLENYEKERKKIDTEISEIENSLKGYKQRVEDLKLELSDRGTQDFLKAANYVSSRAGQSNRVIDVSEAIAENISAGNIDEETKKFFYERMGIDLDAHKNDKNEVRNAMKHFFGLDQEDMEKLIRKLKIRAEVAAATAPAA